MRQVISGNGVDTTATVLAALKTRDQLWMAHLFLIGDRLDPKAIWLTDWESPLYWGQYGTFNPGRISRGSCDVKIGLEVATLDLKWTPQNQAYSANMATANPYQLAQLGMYDNWPVRIWKTYMPTAGDANTWGAMEWFGGRVAESKIARGEIQFTVNSFLDVVNQKVPLNVIELTNSLAGFKGATPPVGLSVVPQFATIATSTPNVIIGDCTAPSAHQIFAANAFLQGFMVFNPGGTLDGFWTAIMDSQEVIISTVHYNQFTVYKALPWAPTPGVDTFYVSATPVADEDGFPWVPSPGSAI